MNNNSKSTGTETQNVVCLVLEKPSVKEHPVDIERLASEYIRDLVKSNLDHANLNNLYLDNETVKNILNRFKQSSSPPSTPSQSVNHIIDGCLFICNNERQKEVLGKTPIYELCLTSINQRETLTVGELNTKLAETGGTQDYLNHKLIIVFIFENFTRHESFSALIQDLNSRNQEVFYILHEPFDTKDILIKLSVRHKVFDLRRAGEEKDKEIHLFQQQLERILKI